MAEHAPIFFPAPADFRAWLEQHREASDHVWVGYYKKASQKASVTWEETVTEALRVGWIDGLRRSIDHESYMIRFTPRKPGSVWSQRNIDLVLRLTEEGRMSPQGLAAFAHKDVHPDSGYAASRGKAALTAQMMAQFRARAQAWAFYQAQPPGYQRNAANWVMSAKRQTTRERRLAVLIADSEDQQRIKPFRKR